MKKNTKKFAGIIVFKENKTKEVRFIQAQSMSEAKECLYETFMLTLAEIESINIFDINEIYECPISTWAKDKEEELENYNDLIDEQAKEARKNL